MMGFLKPKVPKAPPPPNPATPSITPSDPFNTIGTEGLGPAALSLISTSSQGLKRRASTERRSLIGG